MSCGCNKSNVSNDAPKGKNVAKGYKENDRYGSVTKYCKNLLIKQDGANFYPIGCCPISYGKCKDSTTDQLWCKTNSLIRKQKCYSNSDCVPSCSIVSVAKVYEEYYDGGQCCKKCIGHVAIYLFVCDKDDCCNGDEGNVVARAWFHFFLCKGEMVFKSAIPVVDDVTNCYPFELRRRCNPIYDCCNELYSHVATDTQALIASDNCYCKYEGCGDLCGKFLLLLPDCKPTPDKCYPDCSPDLTGNIKWHFKLVLLEECKECKGCKKY